MKLVSTGIKKVFSGFTVLSGINLEVDNGEGLVITGANGSGKSTLIKILCGLLRATAGSVEFMANGKAIPPNERRLYFGLVSPELQLYNELTAYENIRFFGKLMGIRVDNRFIHNLLEKFGLKGRGEDTIKSYSSGMKQRLKFIVSTLHSPEILFLDEPTSNLDEEGIRMVDRICFEQKKRGILIIATNEKRDLAYGEKVIELSGSGSRNSN